MAADVYMTACAPSSPACGIVQIQNVASSSDMINVSGQPSGYVNTNILFLTITANSKFNDFPTNIFTTFPKLVTLELKNNNNLSNVATNAFNYCGQLSQLFVENQQFPHLPAAFAQNCLTLDLLFANNSTISTLDPNALQGLSVLKTLYLDNNRIQTIPSGFFSHTPGLVMIDFSFNQICAVDSQLFKNLPKLMFISFHTNRFSYVNNFNLTGTGLSATYQDYANFGMSFQFNPIVAINPLLFDSIFQSGYQRQSSLIIYGDFPGMCYVSSIEMSYIYDTNWSAAKSTYTTCFNNWTPDLENATCATTTSSSTTTTKSTSTTTTLKTSSVPTTVTTVPPQTTVITLAPAVAPACAPVAPPCNNPSKVLEVILSAFRNMTFSVNFI
jgi:hypothetical protein